MKKNETTTSKVKNNLRNLIPYLGVLLVAAGIIGLLFIQKPLQTSQDIRKEAAFQENLVPSIKPELRVPLVEDKTGEIAFHLKNENYNFQRVYVVFSLSNKYLDTPEVIVNQGSGYDAERTEIEKTTDGYLVSVIAVPNNLNWFVEPADKSLIRIKLVPRKAGTLSLNFDKDRTYGETKNLEVFIDVPGEIKYDITGTTPPPPTSTPSPTPPIDCSQFTTSSSCSTSTISYCAWYVCASECHPRGTPTETVCPPQPVQGCNEFCNTNAECEVGMRCYTENGENRCRLATNPTSSSCQTSTNNNDNQVVQRSCNQFCANNAECTTGLTCWNSFCRNPENPEDNRCTKPTSQQATLTINGCSESCSTNADCAINLRCYEGECRLATNPSSTSCSAVTKQTVSTAYLNKAKGATTSAELADSDTPLNKGDNLIPTGEIEFTDQEDRLTNDRVTSDDSIQPDETILGLLKSLISNSESKLPLFVMLFGAMLLVLSILAASLSRLKRQKPVAIHRPDVKDQRIDIKTFDVQPGSSRTKELLKTLENQPKD